MKKFLGIVLAVVMMLGICVSGATAEMSIEEKWQLQDDWRAMLRENDVTNADAEDLEEIAGRRLVREDWMAILLIASIEGEERLAELALEMLIVPDMSFDDWRELCLIVGYSDFENISGFLLGGMLGSAKTPEDEDDVYEYAMAIEDIIDRVMSFGDCVKLHQSFVRRGNVIAELWALEQMYRIALEEPAAWKWQAIGLLAPEGSVTQEMALRNLEEMTSEE